MARVPVKVRDAVEGDATRLHTLWKDLAADLVKVAGTAGSPTPECQVAAAITRLADDPRNRIVVATVDGEVVGCAFLGVGLLSPLHDDRVVHISHLKVDPRFTRHGAGRGLVEACVTWAEQHHVETLMVATPVNDREANRFLARLGLAQVANLRATSVSSLRARVPHEHSPVQRGGARVSRNVGQVVAARRSQRRARSGDVVA